MNETADLCGRRFGRLVVRKRFPTGNRRTIWLAKCDCGRLCKPRSDALLSGITVSCGCFGREQRMKASWKRVKTDQQIVQAFYKRVKKTRTCWIWIGSFRDSGYGRMYVRGKGAATHRLSYRIHKGPIPNGLQVRHTCDNKKCVNPCHLVTGTALDNAADAKERLIHAHGSKHGMARIDEVAVRRIRRSKKTSRVIASKFDLSITHVNRIRAGSAWGHV